MPLSINNPFSQPATLLKSTAVAFSFKAMKETKDLTVAQKIGKQGNPSFERMEALEGRPWLISLGLEYKKLGLEFEFDECIATINQEKNIISTALQGRDGTIKEYISDGDYNITLDVAINNGIGEMAYPLEKLQQLQKLVLVKDALTVQSDFFEVFKIGAVVITGYNLAQETHSNRQAYQINMLSDLPYTIKTINKGKEYVTSK